MSQALILEFEGATPEQYAAVNETLGLDPATGEGDWPPGLLAHTGAMGERLTVVEVWDSQESQQTFMDSRLGAALGQAGVPAPSRMEWLTLLGHQVRG
jgi:hypothetical protein